jgi:hypothetical protein
MRLAWFRSRPVDAADRLDPTAGVIRSLRGHEIDVITAARAHDFVWRERRARVDLCVFELDADPDAAFMWPYVFRFPGVLAVSGASLHNGRAALLEQQDRTADYQAEFTFNEGHPPPERDRRLPRGSWPMLRAAVSASRLVVVRDQPLASRLQADYPDARIRYVPLGLEAPDAIAAPARGRPLRCAVFGAGRTALAARAAERAAAGTLAIDIVEASGARDLDTCDVAAALTWPAHGESLMPALAALAAGKPTIVFDTEATADWPTLDPQTWRPRGSTGPGAPPIAIAIDPRDEEHSLMLALRRLVGEPGLQDSLSNAGREWWLANATLPPVVRGWERVIEEGLMIASPALPADWPRHLSADGTAATRALLERFRVEVDFLR